MNKRKLVIYRTMGKLDYAEYWLNGVWKNQKACEDFLRKNPSYQYGSIQVIKHGKRWYAKEHTGYIHSKPMSMVEILQYCDNIKKVEKESRVSEPKPEKEYLYNREVAEEWVKVAKENNWDLNVSLKPLCEHLNLAPVVVAPVLQRYGFVEKRKPTEKTYKYSKEQVQEWWDKKNNENLDIKKLAEAIGIHFLQVGRAFTQYGFAPKKEKKPKGERKRRKRKSE